MGGKSINAPQAVGGKLHWIYDIGLIVRGVVLTTAKLNIRLKVQYHYEPNTRVYYRPQLTKKSCPSQSSKKIDQLRPTMPLQYLNPRTNR